jgi:DNA-directed RNA polymerase specialized sigma24 family protein
MDSQHKRIRAELSAMAPKRAIAYILSFELPDDEAACIIECDVRQKSCIQVADMLHVSVDGLAKIRRRAYTKIADGQEKSTDG